MAKLKAKDLKGMSKNDLAAKEKELRKELIKLSAQRATGTIAKNPLQIRNIKKNIARILTIISMKNKEETKKNE
jgi:ribosomal protein L29